MAVFWFVPPLATCQCYGDPPSSGRKNIVYIVISFRLLYHPEGNLARDFPVKILPASLFFRFLST
jgi:hypothetical protein